MAACSRARRHAAALSWLISTRVPHLSRAQALTLEFEKHLARKVVERAKFDDRHRQRRPDVHLRAFLALLLPPSISCWGVSAPSPGGEALRWRHRGWPAALRRTACDEGSADSAPGENFVSGRSWSRSRPRRFEFLLALRRAGVAFRPANGRARSSAPGLPARWRRLLESRGGGAVVLGSAPSGRPVH